MSIAASRSWDINAIDISSAFLQGDVLQRDIYLRPPLDACDQNRVWRLKRCIYGLNDAPRCWYERVKREMERLGGKRSIYDQAVYLWHDEFQQLIGILVSFVDDFSYCGTNEWCQGVITEILNTFKISRKSSLSFKYLGLNVVQTKSGISIDQYEYVNSLKPMELDNDFSGDKILSAAEKSELRSASGQFSWVVGQTRPDMAFENCQLSNYGRKPTYRYLRDANKALRKMKRNQVQLKFPKIENIEQGNIICYADATHASLPGGGSQGAHIIFIKGEGENCVPISWQSKKLSRVTKSPLASETLAVNDGADASYLLASIMQEIFPTSKRMLIEVVTDSQSLQDTSSTSNIVKDARLRVDMARLRQMVERNEIEVTWMKGSRHLADTMTKKCASANTLLEVLQTSALPKEQ